MVTQGANAQGLLIIISHLNETSYRISLGKDCVHG